jgi:hypothetical protein
MKKMVLWISIVIFISILIIHIISNKIGSEEKIQELNVKVLKNLRCLATCPYENIELASSNYRPAQECAHSCSIAYPLPSGQELENSQDRLIENKYEECFNKVNDKDAFVNCVDTVIKTYSSMDLSSVKADYKIVEIGFDDIICRVDSAHITVTLVKGKIEDIWFNFRDNEQPLFSKKVELLTEGETKTYEILYNTEETLEDVTEVSLVVESQGKVLFKGFKSC